MSTKNYTKWKCFLMYYPKEDLILISSKQLYPNGFITYREDGRCYIFGGVMKDLKEYGLVKIGEL